MELHVTLLVVAGLLIVVSLIQPIAVRLGFSASVLLALVGISIGVASTLVMRMEPGTAWSILARVFVDLPVNADTFLYIFLPALLFQSALNIEVQRIIEDAGPILLLAVIAVLVATVVIGVSLAPFAGVSIVACLMLGAIVATTDPVAVIGIFRDVGAPSRLSRLLEGESLLNDAAAITLFTLLVDIQLGGHGAGIASASIAFVRGFVGGIAVGYVGARMVVGLVSWLQDLRLAQVTITLALPYLVFIVGERALGVSGVVAAVAAGLVLNASGQPRMLPRDWRFLHDMWEQLAFWASSLIFILASLLVPRLLVDVGWHDVWLLLVLVVAALAARALVLFGLLPAMDALGLSQRIDSRFKTVILWGGLRGAVTLALALAVTENHAIDPAVQRFIAVLATGFVLFTLLVSGTTLRLLIRILRLDRLSPFDQALRTQVLALSHARVGEAVRRVGRQYRFPDELIASVATDYLAEGTRGVPSPSPAAIAQAPIDVGTDEDRLRLGLVALATRERELVLEHFTERTVSGRIVEELLADVGRLIDRTRAKGLAEYIESAHEMVGFSPRFRFAHFLHRRLHIDRLLVDALADRFERLLVGRIVLEELVPYVTDKLAPLLGERMTPRLRQALDERQQMTASALEALGAQYPAYAVLLERRFLNRVALRREAMDHQALFEEQVIGPELYRVLHRELQAARAGVDARPRLDLGLETRALVAQVPMFAALTPPQLDAIAHLLRPRFAVPGERLIQEGDEGDAMYFVCAGAVEVKAVGQTIRLGRGEFFGEMALVLGQRRQADVTSLSYCLLLVLREDDFQSLLKGSKAIRARIDSVAAARARMNEDAQDSSKSAARS